MTRARSELVERLRSRRGELEAAIIARVSAISEPVRGAPEYMDGLRTAVAAAIEHGLTALECSEDRPPPVPTALIAQARLAARLEVPLDSVLRRYFAGYTLLLDFVVAEARESSLLGGTSLQDLLRGQSLIHERVIETVSEEYAREPKPRAESSSQRRAAVVKRLLEGEPLDTSSLEYEFEGLHHCGFVVRGTSSEDAVRGMVLACEGRRLVVAGEPGTIWGWIGAREPVDPAALVAAVGEHGDPRLTVTIGEPEVGMAGWRLTHRQARAAMPVALRRRDAVVRYVDVALLCSLIGDELLADSLRSIYLKPLAEERDGGAAARRTLRAYFEAGRNVSSAAAALGANRQTVSKRLRAIDEKLSGALFQRSADLEAALRLDQLTAMGSGDS